MVGMSKEDGIEAIKRHLEAIDEIICEMGCPDYLDASIMDGHISINNDYTRMHKEDGLGFALCRINGEWLQYQEG